jgi:uncharacterized protein YecE (DUF72 family)
MAFNRDQVEKAAAALAQQGVFIGTSSWKYPGWKGQLYDESRYIWRGRFSEARLEKYCLTEYAQVFKTVCVDAAYYKFPDDAYLGELVAQVPADFLFAFKVTDLITIKRFANLPRFGVRAGAANADFLNADLFETAFLQPCKQFQRNIGLLMFEFSRFYSSDFERGRDFVETLDRFLGKLPKGWPYGVEIRNRNFLQADYFAMLARHGAVHVYNSWQNMPSLSEQMALPGSLTNPNLAGARLLLRPGRKYEEAVKLFSPYDQLKDPNPEGRSAVRDLIRQTRRANGKARAFIYVNNRFEGNALETISALLDETE